MNHPFDLLKSNLLDLLHELREADIRLIVGGGYGLYVKRQHLQATEETHLLPLISEARSTNDLDLFLTTQILVDPEKSRVVLRAMQALQCETVLSKENFQFTRRLDYEEQAYEIKFDFLTKMPDAAAEIELLDVQKVRVRGNKHGGVHAHLTKEAIAVEDNPILVALAGLRTTGEEFSGQVYLPQAYSYLMMKLFAFRDWETVKKKPGNASKHALDVYSIVSMMTEVELATAEMSSRKYRLVPAAQEASSIVSEFFSGSATMGIIRLREHPYFDRDVDITEFMSILTDLFPR